MAFTNVYCVLVVQPVVHLIGGTPISTSVLLSSYKPTDGWRIAVIRWERSGVLDYRTPSRFIDVTLFLTARRHAQRD